MAKVALSTLCCERANFAKSERLPPSTALPIFSKLKPRPQLLLTRELELRSRESTEWWRALESCLLQRLKGRQSSTAAGSLWIWGEKRQDVEWDAGGGRKVWNSTQRGKTQGRRNKYWFRWKLSEVDLDWRHRGKWLEERADFNSFYLSFLEAVWTQCTGVVVSQMTFDIDDIRPCSTHPHHIKTLPCQVVSRDKGGFLTLWLWASLTALDPADLHDQ